MHLDEAHREPRFSMDITSLAQRFENGPLPKALKEVVITIQVPTDTQWDDALLSFSTYRGWMALDEALWKSSASHKFHILIDINDAHIPDGASMQLENLISITLPRLRERATFSVGFGSCDQVFSCAPLRA